MLHPESDLPVFFHISYSQWIRGTKIVFRNLNFYPPHLNFVNYELIKQNRNPVGRFFTFL